jgi:hypothetical protein
LNLSLTLIPSFCTFLIPSSHFSPTTIEWCPFDNGFIFLSSSCIVVSQRNLFSSFNTHICVQSSIKTARKRKYCPSSSLWFLSIVFFLVWNFLQGNFSCHVYGRAKFILFLTLHIALIFTYMYVCEMNRKKYIYIYPHLIILWSPMTWRYRNFFHFYFMLHGSSFVNQNL